jgi:hypothetical protein
MLYMIIERFREGSAPEIYRRVRDKGRMMPDGLEYVSSAWKGLIEFQIVPVRTSAEAAQVIAPEL